MAVKPIPTGYHTVTPYLIVDGAASAIDFYKKAFGAVEKLRMPMGERIGHAELQIGDSIVMLSDEWGEMGMLSPKKRGGPTASLMIYTENVDRAFKQATDAGATVMRPLKNEFYGDRTGTVADPFGHHWTLSTHVEDVPEAEMKKRMEDFVNAQTS
jgi:PhnB protein